MIWYNSFKTLVHAERINAYKSGTHYTIIVHFFSMCIIRTCLDQLFYVSDLTLGELVHDDMFGLFEAMSAIEMMDPKMDAGMFCNRAKGRTIEGSDLTGSISGKSITKARYTLRMFSCFCINFFGFSCFRIFFTTKLIN